MIAALYVRKGGCYYGLPDVDPWPEERDARNYDGPWPAISHAPCQRWGKMWFGQPLTVKRTGIRKVKGDDGGCFVAALAAVRQWGGVIEHPWGAADRNARAIPRPAYLDRQNRKAGKPRSMIPQMTPDMKGSGCNIWRIGG